MRSASNTRSRPAASRAGRIGSPTIHASRRCMSTARRLPFGIFATASVSGSLPISMALRNSPRSFETNARGARRSDSTGNDPRATVFRPSRKLQNRVCPRSCLRASSVVNVSESPSWVRTVVRSIRPKTSVAMCWTMFVPALPGEVFLRIDNDNSRVAFGRTSRPCSATDCPMLTRRARLSSTYTSTFGFTNAFAKAASGSSRQTGLLASWVSRIGAKA